MMTDKHAENEPEQKEKGSRRIHPRSFLLGMLVSGLLLILLLTFLIRFPLPFRSSRPDSILTLNKIAEIETLIRSDYLNSVDEKSQTDDMLLGLVSGLGDKYSAYYTKEEYEKIEEKNQGKKEGIGIYITQDATTGNIVITSVQKDSPAETAGLKKNDILASVNGTDLSGLGTSDIIDLIQNSESSTIKLTVTRKGTASPLSFSVKKAPISTVSAAGTMLDNKIGYIQISRFTSTTPDQFRDAYSKLTKDGMKALVIDLRDDPGGLVDSCCDTVSQILPKGVILYEDDKNGQETSRTNDTDNTIKIPLVLLVNENTASAAEIFTGAVKAYGLAEIVGETTYGKGIEQNSYRLSDGSVLKITTTHYFTPDHSDINGVGIKPDTVIKLDDSDSDTQLDKALKILKGKLDK